MNKPLSTTIILVLFIFFFSFCENTETQDISFNDDVLLIFQTSCISCHSSDAGEGNLNLSSYAALTSGNNDHPDNLIIPGNPFNSLLYLSVTSEPPAVIGDRMPKGGPYLQDTEIRIIEEWIEQGAKDN